MTTIVAAREPSAVSHRLRAAGWVLHLYTASGTVLALLAVIAVMDGDAVRALWILLIALFVDGTDGMLARRLRVKETIPTFDGARLDDIVDYITYAFVPMVLLWRGDYLPAGTWGTVIAAIPLRGLELPVLPHGREDRGPLLPGFPSYWNVVAFYVVVLELPAAVTATILVVCAVLVFVPVKYVYPSRTNAFRTVNLTLAGVWLVLYAVILADVPHPQPLAIGLSLAYVAYYAVVSVYLTLASRRTALPR